jgi:small subunit ribosomal protein S9
MVRNVKPERYFEGVGRRKSAVARVRFYPGASAAKAGSPAIVVNEREFKSYFPLRRLHDDLLSPLKIVKTVPDKFSVSARVKGGGTTAQEEAVRLGLARALAKFSPESRKELKDLRLLTRDARVVERKKYGLRKARRASQWRKR